MKKYLLIILLITGIFLLIQFVFSARAQAADLEAVLEDGAGASAFTLKDSSDAAKAKIDSLGRLKLLETGETPTSYTIFQGGDQAGNLTYTLPIALPSANGYLQSTSAGTLSWAGAANSVNVQTFSTPGIASWTKPTGALFVRVIVVGGGGGAATAANTDSVTGGGGGGGYSEEWFVASILGSSETLTVGSGGSIGNAGETSSFGTGPLLQATGGGTTVQTATSTTIGTQSSGGTAGVGSGGDINIKGTAGQNGVIYSGVNGAGGDGGSSVLGGGGAGAVTNSVGGAGGSYGGGGGGAHASGTADRAGGAGADGVVIVITFTST